MRTGNKYLLFFYLLFLIPMLGLGIANQYDTNSRQQPNLRNVLQEASAQEIPTRQELREIQRQKEITAVKAFFAKYHSPLEASAKEFVDAAYVYGIDYRILPAIAGAESTFGKFTPTCAEYNPFGYTSTTSPCHFYRFKNYSEAIWKVAETIGSNKTYAHFQESGSITELAENYNNGEPAWINTINYFINEL
jgi:hypothetical protein